MTRAESVHSTPRRTAPKFKVKPVESPEEPSRDLAYRRLEDRVNDLDRLCEITADLVRHWLQNPQDERAGSHAAVMAEITQDRMREFKTTYYEWYHAPLKGGDDYVIIPSCASRGQA